jgi:hypothetical protein
MFKLARVEGTTWKGTTGASFEVAVAPSVEGGPFLIHSVCYGEKCLVQAPFKFKVLEGDKGLSAVYDWDQEGAFVDLTERDGGDSQSLRKRRYKESEPFQSILIQGR